MTAAARLAALPLPGLLRAPLAERLLRREGPAPVAAALGQGPAAPALCHLRARAGSMLGRPEAADDLAAAIAAARAPALLDRLVRTAAQLHGRTPAHAAALAAIAARADGPPLPLPGWRLDRARLALRLALAAAPAAAWRGLVRDAIARTPGLARHGTIAGLDAPVRPKLFVVGLSRTGTTSLTAALSRLGYRTAHWSNPLTGQMLDAEDGLLFDALTDAPVADAVETLADRHPDARVLLSHRPLDGWAASFLRMVRRDHGIEGWDGFARFVAGGAATYYGGAWAALQRRLMLVPGGPAAAQAAHTARVRARFRAEPARLLEFDLWAGDGWGKLCGFLGVPVPAGPFPRENASGAG